MNENIGYKTPPVDHQFKPGQSGNLKGRPRGRANHANIVKAELNRPVPVRIGGKTQRMPAAEAILHALSAKSAAGDSGAFAALEKILDMTGRTNAKTDEARERTGMRLTDCFTQEEADILCFSEARERDRQICRRLMDYEDEEHQSPEAASIPAFIKAGDELERRGRLDEALRVYQDGLAGCREEMTLDRESDKAPSDFRCGVARISLLADRLLHEGEFRRAIMFLEAALVEGSSEYWVPPKLAPYEVAIANITWIRAIRAHALMLSGDINQARAFYKSFSSNKRLIQTSWETSFLRDFIRLRKCGFNNSLMDEIEQHLGEQGWNTGVQNSKILKDEPAMKGEDAVYVKMHPDELKSGDLLLKFDQPDDAMKAYFGNLKKWVRNVEKVPDREDWKQKLAEAGDRVTHAIMLLFRAGRFFTPPEYADEALNIAPSLLQLHLIRACSLIFVGKREDEVRSLFLKYRGHSVGGKSWDDAVLEKFQELRKIGCGRQLMDDIEAEFAKTPGPAAATFTIAHGPDSKPSHAVETDNLAAATDIASGDKLFEMDRIDEALTVYLRRLRQCNSLIANGISNNRTIDDKNALPEKINQSVFASLLKGDFAKALAATEALSQQNSPSPLPVLVNLRRGHALLLLERTDEAKAVYLKHPAEMEVVSRDFEALREAGIKVPSLDVFDLTNTKPTQSIA